MKESTARILIDKLLRESDWILPGDSGRINVETELLNKAGIADYTLKNSAGFPICVIEAKREIVSPLTGKEQARGYANSLGCRFVILSNGVSHYLWDLEQGSPTIIHQFPSQEQLELRKDHFNPPRAELEDINNDYIAITQFPIFAKHPDYINEAKRETFVKEHKLRLLRDYQLEAVLSVQNSIASGNDRFLLEMATGTGKTLTSSAIIKMFLRLYKVKRVLFLVDRIELETQAQKEFVEVLKNDFWTVIWKENKNDWISAEIVVSTVQSFVSRNKYRKIFKPNDFDLVISDEAHRSLGARSRKVFEYFIGFKLGLTATPRDYLKSVDMDKISTTDPRQLEKRIILDTYTTFGCESGEPTFRYTLEEGVKQGYLVNPRVIDARTGITTELLSKRGYFFQGVDEDGNDVEGTFTQKDFERTFFSDKTNTIFCETFLKHANRDPYTDEIGKTLVFCVSQKHASRVTQILNVLADKIFSNTYNSDFAVQVTSNVDDSQRMTIDFRNNKLNGNSKINPHYRTSKSRVCVTVGMMTTGYDCPDVLNICMVRPVYSPSEFIQMKGRGTRKKDFSADWMTKEEIPDQIDSIKQDFVLFDFFGNYEFFEMEFDYDEVLVLPQEPSIPPVEPDPRKHVDEAHNYDADPLKILKKINISSQGMKIDRDLYRSFKAVIAKNVIIRDFVKKHDFESAETYLNKNIFDKPVEFFTLEKLRKSLDLDRRLTIPELLLHALGHIDRIKSKIECLDEEFDKLDSALNPEDSSFYDAKHFFQSYALDSEYRKIIDTKKFAQLNVHPSGQAFKNLPSDLRNNIPAYIKKNVDLEKFANVG